MNYNLKKTKTSDAETLNHFLTVLRGMFQSLEDAKYYSSTSQERIWKGIQRATKDYIAELFRQNL